MVGKLVDGYLRNTLLVKSSTHSDQHAYTVRRFTETALRKSCRINRDPAGDQVLCPGLLLDIEDAFNNTSREAIREPIVNHEIPLLSVN